MRLATIWKVVITAAVLNASSPALSAEISAIHGPATNDRSVATNLAGVRAYLAPTAGFDPLTASDAQLAAFGFPPRPGADAPEGVYEAWRRAALFPIKRIVPMLRQTHNLSRVTGAFTGSAVPEAAKTYDVNSGAWSGYIVYDPHKPFRREEVYAEYVVPVAQQPFNVCDGTTDYGTAEVGIDGWDSGEFVDAGTYFSAYCYYGYSEPSYGAMYEWYPSSWVNIDNLPVASGDLMAVYVWSTGSATASATIINWTTDEEVSIAFSAPADVSLRGSSVDWISPSVSTNGVPNNLTNYTAIPFTNSFAFNTTGKPRSYYYPSTSPTGSIYRITMVDNNGKPLAFPKLHGVGDIWLYNTGSSY